MGLPTVCGCLSYSDPACARPNASKWTQGIPEGLCWLIVRATSPHLSTYRAAERKRGGVDKAPFHDHKQCLYLQGGQPLYMRL